MDEPELRYLLSSIQVDLTKATHSGSTKGTKWLNIKCPFAPWRHQSGADHNPSFGVTINKERRSVYKCFSCGSKGRISQLPSQLGHLRKRDYSKQRKWAELAELRTSTSRPLPAWESPDAVELDETVGYNGPPDVNRAGYPRALGVSYLRNRGISRRTTLLCDLRYDTFQQRVLFPCYDRNESFVGFTGRSTKSGNNTTRGNDPKVRDYYGLPKRHIFLRLPRPQRIGSTRNGVASKRIVVEGLFDFARLVQHGYRNTHCILGTAHTEEKLDILITDGEPCFFLLDNDLAGWQALFGTKNDKGDFVNDGWADLLYREIPVWIVPWPKLFDGSDPGQLEKADLERMLKKAWLYTGRKPLTKDKQPLWRIG